MQVSEGYKFWGRFFSHVAMAFCEDADDLQPTPLSNPAGTFSNCGGFAPEKNSSDCLL